MEQILKLAKERRSVRTFDGRAVGKEELEKLTSFMSDIQNPYGIPVEFKLLDAKTEELKCPVVSGTDLYLGGKVRRLPHVEEAFGYSFEMLVLYAQSMGIGTVWIGGTMDRASFQRAMELSEDEMMPCVSPLGYTARKMSVKESVMRKAIKADSRLPFETLFYEDSFDTPLTKEKAGALAKPLEAVRLSPSAVNRQPWRAVITEDAVHFYIKRNKGFVSSSAGDMQKIDLGIALCHFELAAKESGLSVSFALDDPMIKTGHDTEYIATYRLVNE